MRVAFLHTAFQGLGGAEVLAAAQGRLLAEGGHHLGVVTFGWSETPWRSLFGEVEVRALPRRSLRDLFALDRSSKWAPRSRRAWPVLGDAEAVVAHSQPLAALLGASGLPSRRLWYCHEPPWRLHPDRVDHVLLKPLPGEDWLRPLQDLASDIRREAAASGARRLQELRGTRALDGLAANSDFGRRALEAIYRRGDVAVIPPVVSFPEPVGFRQGLRRGGLQILTQARLGRLKNVEAVLRGFARYARRAGTGARLHVVGDGSDRPRLEALAATLGIRSLVRFHGALDPVREAGKLAAIQAACEVFALLPIDESFGLVFPESAARGLLLVGPDHGGPVEILEGGRLGACLPVFDPEALAEAFWRIERLSDPEVDRLRAEADRACRARYGAESVGPSLRGWVTGKGGA